MNAPVTERELEELREFADALRLRPDSTAEEVAGHTIKKLLDEIERLRGRVLAWKAAAANWRRGARMAKRHFMEMKQLLMKYLKEDEASANEIVLTRDLLRCTLYQDGHCQLCSSRIDNPHEIDCEAAQVLDLPREDSPADAQLPVDNDWEPDSHFEIDETEHERGVGCWCDPASRPPCTTCGGLVHEQPVWGGVAYVCEPRREGSR